MLGNQKLSATPKTVLEYKIYTDLYITFNRYPVRISVKTFLSPSAGSLSDFVMQASCRLESLQRLRTKMIAHGKYVVAHL